MWAAGWSGLPLTQEEKAIIRRARGGHVPSRGGTSTVRQQVPSFSAQPPLWPKQEASSYAGGQYPAASVRTLELLGRIDALLKAPPTPKRSTLLNVLSILEDNRERQHAQHN